MRATRCTRLLLGATALTTLIAPAALAQDDPSVFTRLGRIVLGGTSGDSVAIDTPQAVTVLNQADIDAEQASTVGELFDTVPGAQQIGSQRVGGVSFNIRGIGTLGASDESRIIVNLDGAAKFYEQYRMGSFFSDPELFRQVEVLRGPASATLYGSGALGGVINFETKDASDFLTGDAANALRTRLQYASNGNELMGSLIWASAPSEQFETLVALNYRQSDNIVDGDGNELSGYDFAAPSGLIKSTYYFGDALEQSLTFSYIRWSSSADDTDYSQTGTLGFGTVDRDITDDTLTIRYQNPASGNPMLDLDVVLSYSNTRVDQYDASLEGAFGGSALFNDTEYGYQTTALKVENTFEMGGEAWEGFITAGVQLSHQERTADAAGGPIGFHPEGTDDKIGLYVQGEFVFGDRLTIVPGLRADFVSLQAGDGVSGTDIEETVFSPTIAAHYQINDQWAVFGSLARTQRVPTLDEIYSFDADEPNSPDLQPETANSVELGFSYSQYGILVGEDALQLKATAFYSEIDDMIARDSTAGTPYYQNVDSATIYGFELEAAYESERAFATLAYANTHGEDNATGATLSSIPAQSLNLRVGGRAPELGLEYGWNGHFVTDIDYGGGDSYAGYAVHDLFVNYTVQQGPMEGVQVGFLVENVLDTQYENSLAGDPGAGRSYNISLTKTFEF